MKLPNKLKIGPLTYNIQYVSGLVDDGNLSGQTISINKDLPERKKVVALIHEILHCINNEVNEQEIEFWASAISQVLLDNKIGAERS